MKRKLRDLSMWFLMFCKRLLYKPSFLVLLVIIPLTVIAVSKSVSQGGAVLRIGLYAEETETGKEIVEKLMKEKSIISFEKFDSEEAARQAVLSDKIQGAWIFPGDMEEKINKNAKLGTLKPLVKVIEQEDTIPLKLSHEILYGSVHPYVAYANYTSFIDANYGDEITPDQTEMRSYYEKYHNDEGVIIMEKIGKEQRAEIDTNFLAFPLRGILALLMVLCGLASVMFFQTDRGMGKFDWMPSTRHIVPAFGSCLAGVSLSAIPVLGSLFFLDLGANAIFEIISLFLYIFCVCGFCLICWILTGTAARLGAFTPFIIIIMLVQCPIFLDMGSVISLLLPPTQYLNAPYDPKYMGFLLIYIAVSFAVALILNCVINRIPPKKAK